MSTGDHGAMASEQELRAALDDLGDFARYLDKQFDLVDDAITELVAARPLVEAVTALLGALIEWDQSQEPRSRTLEANARVRRDAAYKAVWRAHSAALARATPDTVQDRPDSYNPP